MLLQKRAVRISGRGKVNERELTLFNEAKDEKETRELESKPKEKKQI